MPTTKNVTIRLDATIHEYLRALAAAAGEPASAIVRRLIKASYFDKFGATLTKGQSK